MSRRQDIWREYERAWLRKHASARRFERVKADTSADDDTDDDELDGNGNGEKHIVDMLADAATMTKISNLLSCRRDPNYVLVALE